MKLLLGWERYSSHHSKVKEEDFDTANVLAELAVQNVIGFIRWDSITEDTPGYEQLLECICLVIDKNAENDASGSGKGVASVSNDGYSETYAVQTEEQSREDLNKSIRAWLSGTGLVGAY